jgi:hypothetical protein
MNNPVYKTVGRTQSWFECGGYQKNVCGGNRTMAVQLVTNITKVLIHSFIEDVV